MPMKRYYFLIDDINEAEKAKFSIYSDTIEDAIKFAKMLNPNAILDSDHVIDVKLDNTENENE